jgi:hypothetical protein
MPELKTVLVSGAAARLAALNIPAVYGRGADIVISAALVEADWSSGRKKTTFEASVLFDEASHTAFMWQKTSEMSSGFSFGTSSETAFQIGKTLFRKLKAVQYGPDGKAFEYDLDIGAIVKAVQETAKQHGWRFKTVLSRAKASYPPGCAPPSPSVAFCAACGKPVTGSFCGSCGNPASLA